MLGEWNFPVVERLRLTRANSLGNLQFVTAMSSMEADEAEQAEAEDTPMWVKYNRLLHGRVSDNSRRKKRELLSTAFLKKYFHYCKFLKPPALQGASLSPPPFLRKYFLKPVLPCTNRRRGERIYS
eukprot:916382-Prorocentrum_minimum.AAC.1